MSTRKRRNIQKRKNIQGRMTERERVWILIGLALFFFIFAVIIGAVFPDNEKKPALIETIVDRTLPAKTGWVCPQCSTIYAPNITICTNCNDK